MKYLWLALIPVAALAFWAWFPPLQAERRYALMLQSEQCFAANYTAGEWAAWGFMERAKKWKADAGHICLLDAIRASNR